MKVRFQAMGTSKGSWIGDLETLENFGKADEVSEVEIVMENGPTILLEEVIDSLTKDTIVSHLKMTIVQQGCGERQEKHFPPSTVQYLQLSAVREGDHPPTVSPEPSRCAPTSSFVRASRCAKSKKR